MIVINDAFELEFI